MNYNSVFETDLEYYDNIYQRNEPTYHPIVTDPPAKLQQHKQILGIKLKPTVLRVHNKTTLEETKFHH